LSRVHFKPHSGFLCMYLVSLLIRTCTTFGTTINTTALCTQQLRLIGRKAAQSIGSHRSLKQHATPPNLQHELFGLDVMLDARGKAWLLETNNSPGLEYCASHFPDGAEDPTAAASDAVTWYTIVYIAAC